MTPLVPHPSTPETAFGVAAGVERVASGLRLAYRVVGDLAAVRVPPPAPPRRTDGLWEHTCFEAFVAVDGEPGYVELNAAPSGAWALYGFARYRERIADPAGAPAIEVARDADALDVTAVLPCPAAALRVGLTAVIERSDGRTSYWALAHPSPRPDFHDAGGFVGLIPPANDRREPRP
jgi:hypothetical protein